MRTVFIGQRGTGKTSLLQRLNTYLQNVGRSKSEDASCQFDATTKMTDTSLATTQSITPEPVSSESISRWVLLDLDTEIEKREKKSIEEIFKTQGEAYFRNLEKIVFSDIISLHPDQSNYRDLNPHQNSHPNLGSTHYQDSKQLEIFISVGGGFNVDLIPESVRVIYLQRSSEILGRIFLDRPSLDNNLSPIEEFFHRAQQRRPHFLKKAWDEYLIPEGLVVPSRIEEEIILGNPQKVGGALTLLPHNFESNEKWHYFIQRRLKWGIDFFEVRDDLLSEGQIAMALQAIPQEKLLFSRRLTLSPVKDFESKFKYIDYDRELINKNSKVSQKILSVHHYKSGENLSELLMSLREFEDLGFHIKLAIEIKNFEELKKVHGWRNQSPNQRSFLPRSSDGRWMWYRLWMGVRQKINFWKEGEGSAVDQPSFYLWLNNKMLDPSVDAFSASLKVASPRRFAALLGSPVMHSFTPLHQGLYFKKWKMPVYPVAIEEEEFFEALSLLESLGLMAAAVTSPLKLLAYNFCLQRTGLAEEYKSVNTILKLSENVWMGHNTDEEGMRVLFKEAEQIMETKGEPSARKIAVWGGGGTLPLIKKLLPSAELFSVQSGQHRNKKDLGSWNPDIVVWAAGRFQDEGVQIPPTHWRPQLIVDLNYREDSGGRELAIKAKAQYVSGLSMFYAQAQGQRNFWDQYL